MPHYKRTRAGVRLRGNSSSTPGAIKGENCKASALQRAMCARNRSYKRPDYEDVMQSIKRKGVGEAAN